jgi:ABC-type transport system substrate-binding protein
MGRSDYWAPRAARLARRALLARAGLGAIGVITGAACASNPLVPTAPTGPSVGAATVGPSSGAAATAASATAQPKYGGTIATISLSAATHLDPHTTVGPGLGIDPAVCFSKLLAFKWGKDIPAPSYVPGPDLAESWTQADDLTYLFKLRPGVKWHNVAPVNGRELTADDIVYSLQRIRDLKTWAGPLAGIARLEAPDKGTVKLTLDEPNADLLNNLCDVHLVVVAREVVDANGDLKTAPVAGTGPWILDNFASGQTFAAKRNPDYFLKGRPYADGFQAVRAGDPAAILNAFRAGAVNVIGTSLAPQAGEDLLKTTPKASVVWVPLDRSPNHLVLNAKAEPFTDLRVRQAVSKALDRKAIIDTVHLGHASLSAGIPLPAPDWNLPEAELGRLLARDVEGARRLLREAGKESGFDLEMIVPPYISGTLVTVAELIQANLKEVGIRATLKTLEGAAWGQLNANGDFQASIATSAFPATNGTLYGYYYTGGPQNKIGYANPALDKLIDQQAPLARDPESRKKVLLDVQRTIIADSIWQCLHNYLQPTFFAAELRDFYPPMGIFAAGEYWTSVWFDK